MNDDIVCIGWPGLKVNTAELPATTPENPAVLVRDFKADKTYVLTGYDVLQAI